MGARTPRVSGAASGGATKRITTAIGGVNTKRVTGAASGGATKRIMTAVMAANTKRITATPAGGTTARVALDDPLLTESGFWLELETGNDYLGLQ